MFKTESFRFFDAQVCLADGADFSRKPELSDHNRVRRQCDSQMIADDSEGNRKVCACVCNLYASGDACEYVGVSDGNSSEFVEQSKDDR